jgi:hypothetical protein
MQWQAQLSMNIIIIFILCVNCKSNTRPDHSLYATVHVFSQHTWSFRLYIQIGSWRKKTSRTFFQAYIYAYIYIYMCVDIIIMHDQEQNPSHTSPSPLGSVKTLYISIKVPYLLLNCHMHKFLFMACSVSSN